MRKIISIRLSLDIVQSGTDYTYTSGTITISPQASVDKPKISEYTSFTGNIGRNYRDGENNLVVEVFPHLQREYPKIMAQMISWAADNIAQSHSINLVGIGGARNSTKSTTTSLINAMLNQMGRPSSYVSMDSYIQPPDFFTSKGIDVTKQAKDPVGIDFKKAYEHLSKVKNLQPFSLQTRDRFKLGYKGEVVHFEPREYDFFLTEGLSSLLPDDNLSTLTEPNPYISQVSSIFDIKMFLKIDEQTAFKNLFNDPDKQKSLGLEVPSREKIYQRFVANEIPRFNEHYKKAESNSHIVVNLKFDDNYYYANRIMIKSDFLQLLDQTRGEASLSPIIKTIDNTTRISFPLKSLPIREPERIAIFTGFFDPFHTMHAALGYEVISRGIADRVIYLPNTSSRKPNASPFDDRYKGLENITELFNPLFMIGDEKKDRNNIEATELLHKRFGEQTKLIWVATDTGKSGKRLEKQLEANDFQTSLTNVISPHCSEYVFFYNQPSDFTSFLNTTEQGHAIQISSKYAPIMELHSTLIRNQEATNSFGIDETGNPFTEVTFLND